MYIYIVDSKTDMYQKKTKKNNCSRILDWAECATGSVFKWGTFEFRVFLLLDWLPYQSERTKSTLVILGEEIDISISIRVF